MSLASCIPSEPERILWDVIVVGTGMGGATAGHELARLGARVLFVEKGRLLHGEGGAASAEAAGPAADDSPAARLSTGRWPHRLRGSTSFGEIEFLPPLGCGSGGSTILYAAGLERFSPADFRPRANFPDAVGTTLPERWPISYEELQPFYERAEALFRVRGSQDPLDRDHAACLLEPPPLNARDTHFLESFSQRGLHPYRLHAGYEFVEGCNGCSSGACARACKSDAARICLVPALLSHGASILPECEVLSLDAGPNEVKAVRCRRGTSELLLRARVVVLAAGAYITPALLLGSRSADWPDGLANRSGLVGRNLMFHASDFIAVNPLKRVSGAGPQKTLAFNDFYLADGLKLGTFQAAGASIGIGQIMQYMRDLADKDPRWWMKLAGSRPRWWRKLSSPVVRLIAAAIYYFGNFKGAAVWATIVEDLPYHHNRVVADPSSVNGMRFEYDYPAELRERVAKFRRRLAERLAPHRVIVLSGANNINFGHVCGTCRFGDDPQSSVLDRDNRAHGIDNLYVVDSSFFPSSGGTNPSLTIAANALRVAGVIRRGLLAAS